MKPLSLQRALVISSAVLLVSSAVALWPAPSWVPPPRPVLRAPIVFDELVNHPPPPASEPSTAR
jgi:hypothetical protein